VVKYSMILVTGGAGFIGSHLVDKLVERNYEVKVLDNFSSGKWENIIHQIVTHRVKVIRGDIRSEEVLDFALDDVDVVFHLAANPEVRFGVPQEHFENNILGTFKLLEMMRKKDITSIVFASSSTVYGDAAILPTDENYSPMKPISVYGASKLACEALISSYAYSYGFSGVALRYANVVGPRSKRGVIYDFINKLLKNPRELEILGDGTQTKSYIWIDDAIDATIVAWENISGGFEAYNVGSIDAISVREIADIIVDVMGLSNVKYRFTGGVEGRGWIGDVKYMHLKIEKLMNLGWKPRYNSSQAVRKTAEILYHELKETVDTP